jgi:hypothetical protein
MKKFIMGSLAAVAAASTLALALSLGKRFSTPYGLGVWYAELLRRWEGEGKCN